MGRRSSNGMHAHAEPWRVDCWPRIGLWNFSDSSARERRVSHLAPKTQTVRYLEDSGRRPPVIRRTWKLDLNPGGAEPTDGKCGGSENSMHLSDRVQNPAVRRVVRKPRIGPARGNNRGPLGKKKHGNAPPHDSAHSWEKATTQTKSAITGATHHPPHMSPSSWKARSITPNHPKQKVERSRESLEAHRSRKSTHNLQRTRSTIKV